MIVSVRRIFRVLAAVATCVGLVACSQQSATKQTDKTDTRGGIASPCAFTQREAIDPIRFSNTHTLSHLHDFFGVKNIVVPLTAEYLFAQEKTCAASGDHSSYWVPTMFDGDTEITPAGMAVYLVAPDGVDVDDVQRPPNGLQMVTYKSSWKCSREGEATPMPQPCPKNAYTRLLLEFPYCWDGTNTRFREATPHVVVTNAQCPASHPVVLPRIVMEVRYDHVMGPDVSFSSGDMTSVHGDIFFAWDQESLARDFDACLRRNIMCGVTWSTELGV